MARFVAPGAPSFFGGRGSTARVRKRRTSAPLLSIVLVSHSHARFPAARLRPQAALGPTLGQDGCHCGSHVARALPYRSDGTALRTKPYTAGGSRCRIVACRRRPAMRPRRPRPAPPAGAVRALCARPPPARHGELAAPWLARPHPPPTRHVARTTRADCSSPNRPTARWRSPGQISPGQISPRARVGQRSAARPALACTGAGGRARQAPPGANAAAPVVGVVELHGRRGLDAGAPLAAGRRPCRPPLLN